jgi:hypothetical protein
MGFEMTRSTPEGEQTEIVIVQDLLDAVEGLEPLQHHCQGCPANIAQNPYGCMNFIQYPISGATEAWMLDQLPAPEEPLIWLLLKEGIENFKYDGSGVKTMREFSDDRSAGGVYFEDPQAPIRGFGEFTLDGNQVFEMIFGVGHIIPNHAAILLLFFHVISRELNASEIMNITPADEETEKDLPYRLHYDENDVASTTELKLFFYALYKAWLLNVRLLVDA